MTVPLHNLTDTWNDGGTTFTAIKMNVTNTASAAGSLLLDLQIGGNSYFNVNKIGTILLGDFALGQGTIRADNTGIVFAATKSWQFNVSGVFYTDQIALDYNNGDVVLRRDAAGILAQRNGTNAQALRVYNTFTDSSNYERLGISWSSNIVTISPENAGTGTARNMKIDLGVGVAGTPALTFGVSTVGFVGSNNAGLANNVTFVCSTESFRMTQAEWNIVGNGVISWGNQTNTFSGSTTDVGVSRTAAKVLRFGDGSANANGWMQWGGQSRVTSDFDTGNSTALTDITGLTATLQAGRTYSFIAELFTTSDVAAGVKFAIAGTATATNIVYEALVDNAATISAQTRATSLGTSVGAVTAVTAAKCTITGTITVNAAGTLTVQMAQNVGNATGSKALRGSYFFVFDMP